MTNEQMYKVINIGGGVQPLIEKSRYVGGDEILFSGTYEECLSFLGQKYCPEISKEERKFNNSNDSVMESERKMEESMSSSLYGNRFSQYDDVDGEFDGEDDF